MIILFLAFDAAFDLVKLKMKVFCVIGGIITIQHQGSSVYFDQGIPGLQQSNHSPLIEILATRHWTCLVLLGLGQETSIVTMHRKSLTKCSLSG